MTRIVAYLVRFVVILVGYAVASLAASAFIHLLFTGWAGLRGDEIPPYAASGLVFSIPFAALFVAYFAFAPALAAIAVAELLGKRDWLFYALAGGIVALVFLAFAFQGEVPEFAAASLAFMATIVGAGMVGGIAYWLAAGRWAGSWRQPKASAPPTSPGPSGS